MTLHIQDDEEAHETMEAEDAGTDMATIEGSGKVDGSTNANLHHASLANPDGTATEGTEETDEGPAYYYADTMMPISGDEDEAPRTTTGRPSGSGRGSAPTNKAKSSRKLPACVNRTLFDDLGSPCNHHRPLCSWLTFTGDRPRTNRCTEAGLQGALLTIGFLEAARLSLHLCARRQSQQTAAVHASLWCTRFWCHRPGLRRIAQQWKTALLVQGICILLLLWIQCNSWYRYNADSPAFMAGPLHTQTSYNADWPYRHLAGLWSLFNILLFHAGLVSQHFSYPSGTARHAITIAQRFPTGTRRSTSTFSRAGPKSDHIPGRHVCHFIFVLLLFTLIPTVESGAVDARVVDPPLDPLKPLSWRSQLGRGRPACLPLQHQADALNDRIAEHIPELASKEERSTKDNGDLRHGSGGYSFGHSTFDLSGRHHRHMSHTGVSCRGTAGALQRTSIEN